MIRRLVELASRELTLEQIHLSVASSQPGAKRLYQSQGFETYGTEPHAMKVNGEYCDEDHMVLRLRRGETRGESPATA
jgi:RimJ/RimL family protein N-acetyltransferase